jgi:hypothetical protein
MNYDARLVPERAPSVDALATYDNSSIGREFVASVPTLSQKREHEERRSQLLVQTFKNTLTDSQSIPKASLQKSREYDTYCAVSQSLLTVAVYIISTCFAGIMLAFIIKNLAL